MSLYDNDEILPPLDDEYCDWLDGGPGQTRAHGSPVGVDAPIIELGTRLKMLARIASCETGDGASIVGVDLDALETIYGGPLPGVPDPASVQDILDFLAGGGAHTEVKESISIDGPLSPSHKTYFWYEGINMLAVPMVAGSCRKLLGIGVRVDAIDAGDFKIEILKDGVVDVASTRTFPGGTLSAQLAVDLSLVSTSELQIRIFRATGSGRSAFRKIRLILTLET